MLKHLACGLMCDMLLCVYDSARKYDYGRKTGDDDDDADSYSYGYSAYGYRGSSAAGDDDDEEYVFTGASGSHSHYGRCLLQECTCA